MYSASRQMHSASREIYSASREMYSASREMYSASREMYSACQEMYSASRINLQRQSKDQARLPTKHKDVLRWYKTVLRHIGTSVRWTKIAKDRPIPS